MKEKEMQNNPLFSIIIPTKNPNLEYFKECLDSVFRQTFKDFELVVVANGCDDEHIEGIKNLLFKIKNSFLIFAPEPSLSKARNFGMEHCGGKYIVFLDDDDAISDDFLKISNECVLKHDSDLMTFLDTSDFHSLNSCDDMNISNYSNNEIKEIFLGNNLANKKCEIRSAWSKVYKKEIINKNNLKFIHNLPAEDIEFVLRYSFCCTKLTTVNKYGYFYRYRPESISHRCDKTIIERFDLLHECFYKDIINHNCNLHYLYFHILNYSLYNISISYLFHKENKLSIFKETNILRRLFKAKYYKEAVKNIKIKEMFTKQKKIMLCLLKCHFYFIASLLLSRRYKR